MWSDGCYGRVEYPEEPGGHRERKTTRIKHKEKLVKQLLHKLFIFFGSPACDDNGFL